MATTDARIYDAWLSFVGTAALTVADEIGVFDYVGTRTIKSATLAKDLRVDAAGADMLLRVLVNMGYAAVEKSGFRLTEISRRYLCSTSPQYWGAAFGAARQRPEHGQLLHALKRGSTYGNITDMWERGGFTKEAADQAAMFAQMMHATISPAAEAASSAGIFRPSRALLDVGGGSGAFCLAAAKHHRALRCSVFDLPEVCAVAKKFARRAQLQSRVTTVPGNFFQDSLPPGFDTILFSNIFHDWSLKVCAALAEKAFTALDPGGRIILHEMLLDPDKLGPTTTLYFSLLMYMHHGAQQLTAAEARDLLAAAGFKGITIKKTFGYYSVVIGNKPTGRNRSKR